jgi:chromosome segregation ATPase
MTRTHPIPELRLRLEIREAEAADDGAAPAAPAAAPAATGETAVALRALEGQCARLKEALVLLRDKHLATVAELDTLRGELHAQTTSQHVLSEQLTLKSAELNKADAAVRALTGQVDAASHATSMLESLSVANATLDDRIQALLDEVTDLRDLAEVSDQAEELQAAAERALRAELDGATKRMADMERALVALTLTHRDAETSLARLSGRSREQEQRIAELEALAATADASQRQQQQDTNTILAANARLASSADRARAHAVELELRALEAEQAARHVECALVLFCFVLFVSTLAPSAPD